MTDSYIKSSGDLILNSSAPITIGGYTLDGVNAPSVPGLSTEPTGLTSPVNIPKATAVMYDTANNRLLPQNYSALTSLGTPTETAASNNTSNVVYVPSTDRYYQIINQFEANIGTYDPATDTISWVVYSSTGLNSYIFTSEVILCYDSDNDKLALVYSNRLIQLAFTTTSLSVVGSSVEIAAGTLSFRVFKYYPEISSFIVGYSLDADLGGTTATVYIRSLQITSTSSISTSDPIAVVLEGVLADPSARPIVDISAVTSTASVFLMSITTKTRIGYFVLSVNAPGGFAPSVLHKVEKSGSFTAPGTLSQTSDRTAPTCIQTYQTGSTLYAQTVTIDSLKIGRLLYPVKITENMPAVSQSNWESSRLFRTSSIVNNSTDYYTHSLIFYSNGTDLCYKGVDASSGSLSNYYPARGIDILTEETPIASVSGVYLNSCESTNYLSVYVVAALSNTNFKLVGSKNIFDYIADMSHKVMGITGEYFEAGTEISVYPLGRSFPSNGTRFDLLPVGGLAYLHKTGAFGFGSTVRYNIISKIAEDTVTTMSGKV